MAATNKSMLLKVKCMAKTRHAFAFSKLWRYVSKKYGVILNEY